MTEPLSPEAERVLEAGTLCYVASATRWGPHVTPLVFAWSGGRLWLTTSRRSVKTRAWKALPRMGGLVRRGEGSVAFSGTVRMHDLLEPATWSTSLRRAPAVTRASLAFSRKNARFFAGYAFDAGEVPFAWTPPGRVFVEIQVERWALLSADGVESGSGGWGSTVPSGESFRGKRSGEHPLAGLPAEIAAGIGGDGNGALAVETAAEPAVLPVRWSDAPGTLHVALPAETLALAGLAAPNARIALCADRESLWRATEMVGAMFQGGGEAFALDALASGARSAAAAVKATGTDPRGAALVRLKPSRAVWWRGFESGTMMPA